MSAAPTFDFTTLERVKQWLDELDKGSAADPWLEQIIPQVTRAMEERLRNKVDRLERKAYPRPNRKGFTRYLYLPAAPVDTAQTFELRISGERDFSDPETVIDAEDYNLNAEAGFIELDRPVVGALPGTVEVTFTGGLANAFAPPDSGPVPGENYLVEDEAALVGAATQWAAEVWRRRKSMGRKTVTERTSGTSTYTGDLTIPKYVMEILEPRIRRRMRS